MKGYRDRETIWIFAKRTGCFGLYAYVLIGHHVGYFDRDALNSGELKG